MPKWKLGSNRWRRRNARSGWEGRVKGKGFLGNRMKPLRERVRHSGT